MIVLTKRNLIEIFLCCIFFITGLSFVLYYSAKADDNIKIIVDAGHGNPDGGAVGAGGTVEKDINLSIANILDEVLRAKGYTVIMTRVGDNGIYDPECKTIREMKRDDMNKRLSIMKKSGADLFVSIHMNSFKNKSAHGLNVFYSSNHPKIKDLAEQIQLRIANVTGVTTHAVRTADEKLFLMKNPPVPSVLVECGFLSNPEEEEKLNNPDYQSRLAWAIAEGIEEYFE